MNCDHFGCSPGWFSGSPMDGPQECSPNASRNVPMGAAVAALHLRVENCVWWYWPSKTQCVLRNMGKEIDSVAEWWRSCTPNNSFYNDICDLWVRCVKTISFYNDLCVSKHPCFIVVFVRAQRIVFYYIFGYIWSHKHHILQKHTQFLQWIMRASEPS